MLLWLFCCMVLVICALDDHLKFIMNLQYDIKLRQCWHQEIYLHSTTWTANSLWNLFCSFFSCVLDRIFYFIKIPANKLSIQYFDCSHDTLCTLIGILNIDFDTFQQFFMIYLWKKRWVIWTEKSPRYLYHYIVFRWVPTTMRHIRRNENLTSMKNRNLCTKVQEFTVYRIAEQEEKYSITTNFVSASDVEFIHNFMKLKWM